MPSGSDGDLAGSGADLDVVPAFTLVVVGAPPVGLPAGGPESEVIDRQPGHSTPDVDSNGDYGRPNQLDVARSATDSNANNLFGPRQPHLDL